MNIQWVFYQPHSIRTVTTMKAIIPLEYENNVLDNDTNQTEPDIPSEYQHQFVPPSFNADGKARMTFPGISFHRNFDLSPLLPFGMMLIICTIVFVLIIFRRWPGVVAGVIAGCLTSISIYLLLLAIKDQKLVYE